MPVRGTTKGDNQYLALLLFRHFYCPGFFDLSITVIMPYIFRQGHLPKLDIQVYSRGLDFTAWRTQWKSYMSLSELSGEATEKQVQALTLCFSCETLLIVQNLGLSDAEKKDVTAIIATIKKYT